MVRGLVFLAVAFLLFAVITSIVGLLVGIVWTVLKWAFVLGLIALAFHHFVKQRR